MNSRRLLFVTGTRADFGKLEPLARCAQTLGFQIGFFVTGMHMMAKYGETRLEVRRFVGADFFEYVNQREGDPQDLVLSKTILGFSDFVHEHRPDLVVIHGDRIEAFGCAIVCALKGIRSAHIEGGEVSGTIDESLRHCNTKLCASHFVSSDAARNRVLMLGEAPERIFVIGSPELDVHSAPSGVPISEVFSRYDISFKDYGIVAFHPVVCEEETIGLQAEALFDALISTKRNFVVISPNNDPGNEKIFMAFDRLPLTHFRILPSMRFNYFSELMKNAAVFIGNSSVGVREAPFLGLPSLNIGTRQHNRSDNDLVSHSSAFDSSRIVAFIESSWTRKNPGSHEFGRGNAAKKFAETILEERYWNLPMQKYFSDGRS